VALSLADPYLKTSRAKVHLENLRQEIAVFNKNPCRFTREDDVEHGLHVITMERIKIPDPIPLIAGDIFYNLRASLDQLVWYLAHITTPYPEMTQFPVLEAPDPKRFADQTSGAPPEAIKIIESLQPYYGRNSIDLIRAHLLWRLNKLCIIDKHRRIPVHGLGGTVNWGAAAPQFLTTQGFDDDGKMKIPLAYKDEMALNPRVSSVTIRFGDSYEGIECDIGGIDAIYHFVTNNVMPRFLRFFT
jgi:hypothetical protein